MMRKTLLCTLSFCLTISAFAVSNDEPRLPGRAGGGKALRQAVPREIVILYESLAPLPLAEQRRVMADISPAVKAQLWAYNLQLFRQQSRQMSQAQRDVIEDALEFLASPGLFEPFERDSEQYRMRQAALSLQKQAVGAVFSNEAIYTLFMRLGAEPPRGTLSALTLRPKPNDGWCECMSTPLFSPECGTGVCQGDFYCIPWMGCGYWSLDACDGMCR